jgi:carboxylesterase
MPILPGAQPYEHDGGPVGALLVHGFTGSPASMRPVAEQLAGAGLSVRLPRLAGHGTDWRDLAHTGWQDWYHDVARAHDQLLARCSHVFVLGLSMGGALALRLAEQRGDRVAGLVLVNPFLHHPDPRVKLVPLLRWVVPSLPGVINDIHAPGRDEVGYDRVPTAALASCLRLIDEVVAALPEIRQPILLFHSLGDHVVDPTSVRLVAQGVRSTEVSVRTLADSYHVATLDYDAPAIVAESLEFVRAHVPAEIQASIRQDVPNLVVPVNPAGAAESASAQVRGGS